MAILKVFYDERPSCRDGFKKDSVTFSIFQTIIQHYFKMYQSKEEEEDQENEKREAIKKEEENVNNSNNNNNIIIIDYHDNTYKNGLIFLEFLSQEFPCHFLHNFYPLTPTFLDLYQGTYYFGKTVAVYF